MRLPVVVFLDASVFERKVLQLVLLAIDAFPRRPLIRLQWTETVLQDYRDRAEDAKAREDAEEQYAALIEWFGVDAPSENTLARSQEGSARERLWLHVVAEANARRAAYILSEDAPLPTFGPAAVSTTDDFLMKLLDADLGVRYDLAEAIEELARSDDVRHDARACLPRFWHEMFGG